MKRDRLVVKICGVTSEADALLAIGLGADAVGFVFAPSPRQVTPTVVADIVKRLPHDVLAVGVFRDEATPRVVEIANTIGLGAVQLHGHETAEQTRWVAERVPRVIKAFVAGERAIAHFEDYGADYLLIDGPSPGSGEVFDWRVAEGVVDPRRLIVSGGLRPENVAQAVTRLRPFGVDVASGVEQAPGLKDPHLVRAFVANARRADEEGAIGDAGPGDGDEPGRAGVDTPYDWMEG